MTSPNCLRKHTPDPNASKTYISQKYWPDWPDPTGLTGLTGLTDLTDLTGDLS